MSKKRVALVLFPIWGAGGLSTSSLHYLRILKKFGHTAHFWQVRYSDKGHGDRQRIEVGTGADGPTIKQGLLSITDSKLRDTLRVLNTYDVVLFMHPAPHVSDKQAAVKNWKYLYTKVDCRKVVRFSDVYLDKLYPWILEVGDTFEAWAPNKAQRRYVRQYFPDVKLATYPMAFKRHGLDYVKEHDLIWPCAWRGWKGIKQFVKAVPDIQGTVELYGSGRELRQFRKAGNPVVSNAHGVVPPKQLLRAMQGARFSVDLTGWSPKYHGHNNRSLFEPMFFGTVVIAQDNQAAPLGLPPSDHIAVVRKQHLAEDINYWLEDEDRRAKVAAMAYEWALRRFDHKRVVREVLVGPK